VKSICAVPKTGVSFLFFLSIAKSFLKRGGILNALFRYDTHHSPFDITEASEDMHTIIVRLYIIDKYNAVSILVVLVPIVYEEHYDKKHDHRESHKYASIDPTGQSFMPCQKVCQSSRVRVERSKASASRFPVFISSLLQAKGMPTC